VVSTRIFKLTLAALAVALVVGILAVAVTPSTTPLLPGSSLAVYAAANNAPGSVWSTVALVCLWVWVLGIPAAVVTAVLSHRADV
jgi:hypothetical protein